ncbi:hypothetical protein ABS71_20505 [bacterium SCN 62-11]|nr:hypothetical protein [Candidatus Eremiobacteraeota bacterium]ODT57172.1 MAG: hypothetical protein ABS71_20505 [bacterium SCN 62-11]
MTGTSEELKQAWIKAWVAYGFGDYDVASKRFQFWLQRFNAERQRLGRHWSPRTQANCEQLLAEIARHIKPARRTTPMGEQQRVNSAFWAGRHIMVMLSRQDRTMEGAVPVVKPTPSGERLISDDAPVKAPPAPRPAAPAPTPAPARRAAPPPAPPAPPARPVEPPAPPVVEPVIVPVAIEPPPTPAPPPPVEVAAAPALSVPPALESEPTVEDIGGLEDLSLDDLDLSELDGDLDLGELDLDDASLEDLDMEGLEDLEDIEGLEGLDDLDLEGDLEDIDLGEV